MIKEVLRDRFLKKISVGHDDGCWVWHGAEFPSGHGQVRKGEKNKSSKLKKEDIDYILNSKESTKKLREMFGVCQATIWNVKNHKTWKHLFL